MLDGITPKTVVKKPRKNQEVLDFLEKVKFELKDANPKTFGLYMKLFNQHGKQKIETALYLTTRNTNISQEGKLRYFLAVLIGKGYKKETRKQYKEQKQKRKQTDGGALYEKMKSKLLKKMTPQYARRAGVRSQMLHKVAKEERKLSQGSRRRKTFKK